MEGKARNVKERRKKIKRIKRVKEETDKLYKERRA